MNPLNGVIVPSFFDEGHEGCELIQNKRPWLAFKKKGCLVTFGALTGSIYRQQIFEDYPASQRLRQKFRRPRQKIHSNLQML